MAIFFLSYAVTIQGGYCMAPPSDVQPLASFMAPKTDPEIEMDRMLDMRIRRFVQSLSTGDRYAANEYFRLTSGEIKKRILSLEKKRYIMERFLGFVERSFYDNVKHIREEDVHSFIAYILELHANSVKIEEYAQFLILQALAESIRQSSHEFYKTIQGSILKMGEEFADIKITPRMRCLGYIRLLKLKVPQNLPHTLKNIADASEGGTTAEELSIAKDNHHITNYQAGIIGDKRLPVPRTIEAGIAVIAALKQIRPPDVPPTLSNIALYSDNTWTSKELNKFMRKRWITFDMVGIEYVRPVHERQDRNRWLKELAGYAGTTRPVIIRSLAKASKGKRTYRQVVMAMHNHHITIQDILSSL